MSEDFCCLSAYVYISYAEFLLQCSCLPSANRYCNTADMQWMSAPDALCGIFELMHSYKHHIHKQNLPFDHNVHICLF